MSVLLILDIRTLASVYLPQMVSILPKPKVHAGSLVSFPDPFRKNQEGVWQHVLHCGVQKEFNQLLNRLHTRVVIGCVTSQLYAVLVCGPSDHGAMSVLCLAIGTILSMA